MQQENFAPPRYMMMIARPNRIEHLDAGTNKIEAYGQVATLVNQLLKEGYTVTAWTGAPYWEAHRKKEQLSIALCESDNYVN